MPSPRSTRRLRALGAGLLLLACGPPPRPLEGAGPPAEVDPHAGHDHPPGEHPGPEPDTDPHAGRAGDAGDLRLAGTLVVGPGLAEVRSGRVFFLAWDTASRTLVLSRAFEVSGLTAGEEGGRRLAFELDGRDYMGGPTEGPFTVEVRLDADGEIRTTEDVRASGVWSLEAGTGDALLRLEAPADR